jgi:alpha-glucoside transport system substrate-binding protein
MRGSRARAACLALAAGLTAALAACGGGAAGGPVTVLVPWAPGTNEYKAFQTVTGQFTKKTGIQINAESTRALTQQLNADLSAGDPPDIADLPNPSAVDEYQHNGLVPIGVSLSSYAQPWRSLAESASGTVLAVPVKADIESLLWYNAKTDASPPRNWAALTSLSAHGTPWCLGLASGPTSGWPGADWVSDILLSTTSADDYKKWLSGTLSWTDPPVSTAWQQWGTFLRDGSAVAGGRPGALENSFSSAISGQCQLEHGALSATGLTSIAGYNYVRFPSASGAASPVMVSGDFMALFTTNPNAKALLGYLASAQAQRLWVSQPGFAFSANKAVSPASYPSAVQRRLALLMQHPGTTLCFTASDMMTPDVSAAFFQAVLDYVNNPDSLKSSLAGLQETEQAAGTSPDWKAACANP